MTNKFKNLFRKRWLRITLLIIALLFFVLAIGWPLLSRFIPPTTYSGVALYESGEYLDFEKGPLFKTHIAQLPFAEDAQIVDFIYYDFWIQDAIFRDEPFPDVYLVQLATVTSYDSVKQYLDAHSSDKDVFLDGNHSIYYLGEQEDEDCFYVATNNQRQEVFCFLVTDYDPRGFVDSFLFLNIGWVPGE